MSTLVITKQTGNFFSLVVDSGEPIISEQNRLTTAGELCNFKTANGANLVLKQNILREDITIIEDNNPVVPSSVQELWTILIGIGFFDGVSVTAGGGSGTDRFKDLLDAFNYIGRSGQIVAVNDSETGLTTIAYALFSPEDRLKFDSIEFGAQKNVNPDWNKTDPSDPATILNKPPVNSIGIFSIRISGLGQTYEIPENAVVIRGWINDAPQHIENIGFESDLNTITQSSTTITFKKTITTGQRIIIDYYI